MDISITDNINNKLVDVLIPSLAQASEIKIAVAFAKYSGFTLLEDEIRRCLEKGGKAEFLFGLDFRTTEPKVLRTVLEMGKQGLKARLFCFSDPTFKDTPIYHPKVYLIMKEEGDSFISIGSSNLTSGGLKDNIEVNAVIEADAREETVSNVYGIYNAIKFQKSRFEPDISYIENYEEAYEIIRKKNIEVLREKTIRNRIIELQEREKTLPKAKASRQELFGWQKLVHEKLPEGIFQSSDLYVYENEFRQYYPENRHITDKIRQILQQLRDIGLLKELSGNRWSKTEG